MIGIFVACPPANKGVPATASLANKANKMASFASGLMPKTSEEYKVALGNKVFKCPISTGLCIPPPLLYILNLVAVGILD